MKGELRIFELVVVLAVLSGTQAWSQSADKAKPLSFDEAWSMTSQNSHVLKQVKYLQDEKSQARKAALGLYLPKVSISANYIMMSDPLHLDLNPVKESITPLYQALGNYGTFSGVPYLPAGATTPIILPDAQSTAAVRTKLQDGLKQIEAANWDKMIQEKNFGTVSANFVMPIYMGGKINAANKAARIESEEVSEEARQKEGELMSELVERYFGLCLANQAVMVRQDVFEGMEHHLSDAQKLQKEGLIANGDVLHAKVYHAQSERELSKARRSEAIVRQGLCNTLVMSGDTLIVPSTELFYLDSIEGLDYFKELALKRNPQLLQVDHKKMLVEQNYKVQLSEYFPEVGVMGTYNIADKDLSPYTPKWMVGVGVKWTLFDGAARYRKVKSASFKSKQVEEFQEKAESDISTMITKLYNELNMYREQLSELDAATEFAEEYQRNREKAFKEEMTNATEVVDANLAVAQVRIERLQAMYNYDLALAHLLQYAGTPETFSSYMQRADAHRASYQSVIKK
jgi:outer membrane protein TolC